MWLSDVVARFVLVRVLGRALRSVPGYWNEALIDHGVIPRLAHAAPALAYLQSHPSINQGLTCMVRQLQPGPAGLPLELYCFTATTKWVEYEGIQADIFDHLYAILPEFGLRVFQEPAGSDVQRALQGSNA